VHVLHVGCFLKHSSHCARFICAVRCRVSAVFCQSPHDVDIWWFLSSGGGSSLPSVCAVYHNVHGSRGWFVADQQWWQLCSRVVVCSARPPTAHPTERYVKREALTTPGEAGDVGETRWMLWSQLALQQAEMKITKIRWMCGIKIADRLMCSELRNRLGIDDIITVMQRHRMTRMIGWKIMHGLRSRSCKT